MQRFVIDSLSAPGMCEKSLISTFNLLVGFTTGVGQTPHDREIGIVHLRFNGSGLESLPMATKFGGQYVGNSGGGDAR